MESEWRLNVWRYGQSAGSVRMLAQLVVDPFPGGPWFIAPEGNFVAGLYYLDPDQLALRLLQVSGTAKNFPYGFDVLPD